MNKTLRKLVLASLVAGATVFAATTAPKVEAATSSNCTYYSDASHTTIVGQYGKDCCNNTVAWGSKTVYSSCGGCFLCVPPPR